MKRIKLLREENRISQQKLADSIGTNQQNIHRYENGFYEPDVATLKLIANFFGTSVDYLTENTDLRHKIEHVKKYDLNVQEAHLVEKYRALSVNARHIVGVLVNELERA